MKTSAQPFLWMVLGVTAATAALRATETEIVALGESGWREQAPALSVASGGTLTLSVLIPASVNQDDVAIELWQVARGVVIPLGEPVMLSAVAESRAPNAQGVTVLRVPFPKVNRKTQVVVKFVRKEERHVSAGRAQVWVYPSPNWAPLARKFKEETPRLVVFGATAELRAFLQTRAIVFTDLGAEPPAKLEAGVLAIGVLSAMEWRERKGRFATPEGRVVVFLADAPGLPGVYTSAAGAGAITQVTLPVMESLSRDARAEDLFFQILEQQLHAAPAALP